MQYGMPHGVLRTQFAFSLTDKVRNPVTWQHAITVRCCRKPVANAATGCWIAAQSLARWITNLLDFLLNYWNSEVIVCLLSCLKRWIVSLPTQMNCSTHTIIPPGIKINCTKEIFSFITKAIDTTRVSGTILE